VQSGTAGTNQPVLHRKKVELSYNSAGRYSEIVRSQGASGSEVEVATGTYSYFDGGALEEIAYDRSGTGISGYAWTYDNVGRVSTFTAPEGTFTYGYDGRGQLTSAAFTLPDTTSDPNRSEAFHHDPTGDFRDGLKSGDLSGV
jgi:YD repeat-containing protein